MKPHDYTRFSQEKELIKRYRNGYKKIPENIQGLKAVEKAGLETTTLQKEWQYKGKLK